VAVDPSSPFTGGAVLGDRVRMGAALADGEVYMRSLANRGHLGGLSVAADDVITLLDAFGFEVILVETVGAGQAEIEVIQLADATVVVVVPGLGDYVQAMKAGILEIADIYVVNKSEREHAERTVADLKAMLDTIHVGQPGLNRWPNDAHAAARPRARRVVAGAHLLERFGSAVPGTMSWVPPIVKTVATEGAGTDAIVDALEMHDTFLRESRRGARQGRARAELRLRQAIGAVAARAALSAAAASGEFERSVSAITERKLDPYSAAERLLAHRS
jgi:LAO/AO transport system kinase